MRKGPRVVKRSEAVSTQPASVECLKQQVAEIAYKMKDHLIKSISSLVRSSEQSYMEEEDVFQEAVLRTVEHLRVLPISAEDKSKVVFSYMQKTSTHFILDLLKREARERMSMDAYWFHLKQHGDDDSEGFPFEGARMRKMIHYLIDDLIRSYICERSVKSREVGDWDGQMLWSIVEKALIENIPRLALAKYFEMKESEVQWKVELGKRMIRNNLLKDLKQQEERFMTRACLDTNLQGEDPALLHQKLIDTLLEILPPVGDT